MKRFFSIIMFVQFILCLAPCSYGQSVGDLESWSVYVKRFGNDDPEVHTYFVSLAYEKAANGQLYGRIGDRIIHIDGSYCISADQGPAEEELTPYGLRNADKRIYVYDFDKDEERVAFDFNLSEGDEFTTLNGMEWTIIEKSDTLLWDAVSLVQLKVCSKQGGIQDVWLENCGSMINLLMMENLTDVQQSKTLWCSNVGYLSITHDFVADSFWGFDLGLFWENYGLEEDAGVKCAYQDGVLTVRNTYLEGLLSQRYDSFYRAGDDIYLFVEWYVVPSTVFGEGWHTVTYTFNGLPEPESGSYRVHIGGNVYLTAVTPPEAEIANRTELSDLHGRRLNTVPEHGVYIEDGKVRVVR